MILIEAARYHSHSSYGEWMLFRALWHVFHWWSILIYTGVIWLLAFCKGLLGIGDDS